MLLKRSTILLVFFVLSGCQKHAQEIASDFQPKNYSYKEMPAPDFFTRLVENHYKDFYAIDHSDIEALFSENEINPDDSSNAKSFYTFKILHKLFTNKSAANNSKGEILNIPYYWHWVNPNPRHEIIYAATNQKLNTVKPPKGLQKYKSLADVDRIPSLFMNDFLSDKPNYSTPENGKFRTFGWCSEREMSFVCLLKTLGYEGKVVTNGNHSWSEFIVPLKNAGNKTTYFKATVDNTFDNLDWEKISPEQIKKWRNQKSPGLGSWYNEKANAPAELSAIKAILISETTMNEIETHVVDYLKKQFD
ncbi:hypothetical protein [Flavobacterium pedocola]